MCSMHLYTHYTHVANTFRTLKQFGDITDKQPLKFVKIANVIDRVYLRISRNCEIHI